MTDRRYSEREIREVFERAAREQEEVHAKAPQDGLTLAEMQEVASSAGIAPEFVERAAQSVALGEPEEGRLMLGPIPRGVSRSQILPAPPTAALWEDLVGDCQEMFEARGSVRQTGRLREWSNGNLRVTLEPLGDGSRLRVRTRRDTVVTQLLGLGLALLVASTLTADAGFTLTNGGLWISLLVVAAVGGGGLWASQRAWSATRERQFEALSERALVRSQPTRVASGLAPPASDPDAPLPAPARAEGGLLGVLPERDDERAPDDASSAPRARGRA